MIQITSVQNSLGVNNALSIDFILFNKIVCSCVFEDKGFKDWGEIKVYIENQLKEDFKSNALQLEGKPSNLKMK